MPKKPVRNAFYFYMKDLEPVLKREGRVFPNGMADIVPIAHPRWKALPEDEKTRYEKMAKEYKSKMRGLEGDKYRMDNVGNILAHRVDPMAEMEKQRQKERNLVKSKWPAGKAVVNEVFYLIDFQTLCRTEEGDYLPAEIAVVEYSIAKGITKMLHKFIEPGRIPLGYSFECRQKSEDYHQIPPENFEHSDANYRGLWIQLENFVNPNGEKPEYPPLYCQGKDIEETAYCLSWVHGKACLGIPNRLKKVYELEGMVADLYAHHGEPISRTSVIDMLTTSVWDYEPKTRCFYHEELECKYCSLAIVKRYTYAMSDSLCSMYEVPLSENHLPAKVESKCTVLPPSTMNIDQRQIARMNANQGRGQRGGPPQGRGQRGGPSQDQILYSRAEDGRNSGQNDEVLYSRTSGSKASNFQGDDDDSSDDSDDDIDYTSLRRPNVPVERPADPSMGWSGVPLPSNVPPTVSCKTDFPSLGRGMPPAAMPVGRGGFVAAQGDFPALGRGMPIQPIGIGRGQPIMPGVGGQQPKYAGRAAAPAPSNAPVPPAAWVQDPTQKHSMADVAQVLNSKETPSVFYPGQLNHPPPQLNHPPAQLNHPPPSLNYPPPPLPNTQNGGISRTNATNYVMEVSVGRGRGILGNVDPNAKVPKGRGYAPPGMDIQKHLQSLKLAQ